MQEVLVGSVDKVLGRLAPPPVYVDHASFFKLISFNLRTRIFGWWGYLRLLPSFHLFALFRSSSPCLCGSIVRLENVLSVKGGMMYEVEWTCQFHYV
jgi:hypothetical protein